MTDSKAPTWLQEALESAFYELKDDAGLHHTPKTVNNGLCREFALEVLAHFDGSHPELQIKSLGYTHSWVEYNGRHFDAETMQNGVKDPYDFPAIQRATIDLEDESVQDGLPY